MLKRVLLAAIFAVQVIFVLGQDTIHIEHQAYTTSFSISKRYPVRVHWTVTAYELTCTNPVPRASSFKADPQLPNKTDLAIYYKKSGYDRGHNMSAADNKCSLQDMKECFYYSNMTPQLHELNAGPWGKIENRTRDIALEFGKVEVWCGSIGDLGKLGGLVSIPAYCWKIILYDSHKVEAYLIPNQQGVSKKALSDYGVSVSEIRKLSGLPLVEFNQILSP